MIKPIPFARVLKMARELAHDGEDADTIISEIRRLHPAARYGDICRAADRAVAGKMP